MEKAVVDFGLTFSALLVVSFRNLLSIQTSAALVMLFVMASCSSLLAQPTNEIDQPRFETVPITRDFSVTSWSTEDGLPDSTVTTIVQTRDGYLWLGTFHGMVRFNGLKFTVFDSLSTPELQSSRITRLWIDGSGRIWARSEFGDLTGLDRGHFKATSARNDLGDKGVMEIAEDPRGKIWAGTLQEGKWSWKPVEEKGPALPEKLRPLSLGGILVGDAQGNSWASQGGESRLIQGREWSDTVLRSGSYPRAISSPRGGVWIFQKGAFFRQIGKEIVEKRVLEVPIFSYDGSLEDSEQNLWLGSWETGLWKIAPDGRVTNYRLVPGQNHPAVRSILQDSEKNIWAGLGARGLWRLRPKIFQTYSTANGLRSLLARSLAEDEKGRIWVAGSDHLDILMPGQITTAAPAPLSLPLPWVILSRKSGGVLVGDYDARLFEIDPHGKISPPPYLPLQPGEFLHSIDALLEVSANELLVGTASGLIHLAGTNAVRLEIPTAGRHMVSALAAGRSNEWFVGLSPGGIWRHRDGQWKYFGLQEGLRDDRILALYSDATGILWIGTAGGLACLREEKIYSFHRLNADLPQRPSSIVEDNEGFLWLGSFNGIYRVNRLALQQYQESEITSLTVHRFTRNDGLASVECRGGTQPSAIKSRDGRLWFPTAAGVSVVDPKKIPINTLPPPVIVEEALLDDVPQPLDRPLVVKPGVGRLEIRYAGLSLGAAERVHFRYLLEGLDEDWVAAGNRREAYYNKLPPGGYTFRVKACNNDGIWNEEGASLTVTKLPHYWQTNWFWTLISALGAGLLAFLYRQRIQGMQRERAQQKAFSQQLIHSQEQERQRIAAELHDSLGQNLLVIRNRSLLGLEKINDTNAMKGQLEEISSTAALAIGEVRTIAHALRPAELDRLGLTKAIKYLIKKVADSSSIRFESNLDSIEGFFPPAFEISFYRIVQECLNNVLKHSQAHRVRITIARSGREVILKVEDDGQGFDQASRNSGTAVPAGMGLTGLAERVALMAGKLSIQSSLGKGTKVEASFFSAEL